MGLDDEISENEEEILVYVEFEGLVDGNVFNEKQLQLDIIGIDTEHPIMQINGRFYEGTYEDVNGTYMFFTKNDNCTVDDPVFDAITNLKYFAKTRKCLKMQRIFIKSRTEVLGDSEHSQCIPNLNTLKQAGIPFQYQKEALSFWKTIRNNRLNALHSYLEKQRIRQQKKSQGIIPESDSDEDNPFAIYKQKEEFCNLNKSEDISIDARKESNYCDSHVHSKYIYSEETIGEASGISKDSYQNNSKPETSTKSESSILKDDSYHSLRSIKGCKTRVTWRKNLNTAYDRQRIKPKIKQTLLKDKTLISNTKDNELSSIRKESEEWNKSDVIKTLSPLEITENKNKEINNKHKIAVVEKSKVKSTQTDSVNDKIVKQLKREAKMKEISEQLKAIAEHLNTKID